MLAKNEWAVVTDLDGSLLNHHDYHWEEALPTIRALQEAFIPIIFNTSKTYKETITLQQEIDITAPFIVENGSCIYLPKIQFKELPSQFAVTRDAFWEIKLGNTVAEIDKYLAQVVSASDCFVMLSACTASQASDLTGLTKDQALNAIKREFSQPIIWEGTQKQLADFKMRLKEQGLYTLQGGRFLHIQGKSNKGSAINKLRKLYPHTIKMVAIGDSQNDLDMLKEADISVVVKAPGNKTLLEQYTPDYLTRSEAPSGWVDAVNFASGQITMKEII